MNLREFRQQYPQYDHVDDARLSRALYDKFYADRVDYPTFHEKFSGVVDESLFAEPIKPAEEGILPATDLYRDGQSVFGAEQHTPEQVALYGAPQAQPGHVPQAEQIPLQRTVPQEVRPAPVPELRADTGMLPPETLPGQAAVSLARGVGQAESMFAKALALGANVLGAEGVERSLQDVSHQLMATAMQFPQSKDLQDKGFWPAMRDKPISTLTQGVMESVPNFAAMLAASAATGPVGGIATAFGLEAGGAYDPQSIMDDSQVGAALATGAVNAALEYLPAYTLLKRVGGDKAAKALLREHLKQAAEEGITETFQEFNGRLMAALTHAPDTALASPEALGQYLQSGLIGAVIGGGASAVMTPQTEAQVTQQIAERIAAAKEQGAAPTPDTTAEAPAPTGPTPDLRGEGPRRPEWARRRDFDAQRGNGRPPAEPSPGSPSRSMDQIQADFDKLMGELRAGIGESEQALADSRADLEATQFKPQEKAADVVDLRERMSNQPIGPEEGEFWQWVKDRGGDRKAGQEFQSHLIRMMEGDLTEVEAILDNLPMREQHWAEFRGETIPTEAPAPKAEVVGIGESPLQKQWDTVLSEADKQDLLTRAGLDALTPTVPWSSMTREAQQKIRDAQGTPREAAPHGPRVIINKVGTDGKTDAERGGGAETPPTDKFAAELERKGAATLDGVGYKVVVHPEDDALFAVEVTRDGKRELLGYDLTPGGAPAGRWGTMEGARQAAVRATTVAGRADTLSTVAPVPSQAPQPEQREPDVVTPEPARPPSAEGVTGPAAEATPAPEPQETLPADKKVSTLEGRQREVAQKIDKSLADDSTSRVLVRHTGRNITGTVVGKGPLGIRVKFDGVDEVQTVALENLDYPFNPWEMDVDLIANHPLVVEAAKAAGGEPTANINTPDRLQLRDDIAQEFYGEGSRDKNRKATIIVGLSGSGKSTAERPITEQTGALVIDPDLYKPKLPGYNKGAGANAVHEESKMIARMIQKRALLAGDDIILPIVGSGFNKVSTIVDGLRGNGYTVDVVMIDVPVEESVRRVVQRYFETGRFIPPRHILDNYGYKPAEVYIQTIKEGLVDHAEAWDTFDPERGGPDVQPRERVRIGNYEAFHQARVEGSAARGDEGAQGEPRGVQEPGERRPVRPPGEQVEEAPDAGATGEPAPPAGLAGTPPVADGEPPAGGQGTVPDTAPAGAPGPSRGASGAPAQATGGAGGSVRSGRTGERGDTEPAGPSPRKPAAEAEPEGRSEDSGVGPEPADPNRRDHVVAPEDTIVPGGNITRGKANIKAIRLLKDLEKADRNATPEEKQTLQQYSGWGSLAQTVFLPEFVRFAERKGESPNVRAENWFYGSNLEKYQKWEKSWGKALHPALGGLLTPEEWEAASASTKNAHYTERNVIESMWAAVERLGFTGGRVVEPAAGSGLFFGLAPEGVRDASKFAGVELDSITGRILAKLYPESDIQVVGFEKAKRVGPNTADLVISNFPFGDYPVLDKGKPYSGWSIHNYFFAKSLDTVRPGGLVAAITSHYSMDSGNSKFREYWASKADLVGAIRLPQTAFKKNAGTDVTTDILFFRKKDDTPYSGESFRYLHEVDVKGGVATVNEYFARHPEMVLGKHALTGTMHGGDEYTLEPTGELPAQLQEAIASLPQNVMGDGARARLQNLSGELTTEKEGRLVAKGGKLYTVVDGTLTAPEFGGRAATVKTREKVARRYLHLRDAREALLAEERKEDADPQRMDELRGELNRLYDAFHKAHGPVGSHSYLADVDIEAPNVFALEDVAQDIQIKTYKTGKKKGQKYEKVVPVYSKADIFTERVLKPFKEPTSASSPSDAIAQSMVYRNRVDLEFISELLGGDPKTLRESMVETGLVFENPETGLLEIADEYLSGDVAGKLETARQAAQDRKRYEANVKALEEALPEPLPSNRIHYRLGATWIDPQAVKDYIKERFEVDADVTFTRVDTESGGQSNWKVQAGYRGTSNVANTTTWGVDGASAVDLVTSSLNMKQHAVYDTFYEDGRRVSVLNKEKTLLAQNKQAEIQDDFLEWARKSDTWAQKLADEYNNRFNGYVLPQGIVPDIKVFPGAREKAGKKLFHAREHQRRGIFRALRESTVLAHGVGSGKTYQLITIAMEMRRLGTANKPMVVLQRSTVPQFIARWKSIYPAARLLAPTGKERTAAYRRRLLSQVTTGNWDAVVLDHDMFDALSVSAEREAAAIRAEIAQIVEAYEEAKKAQGARSPTAKQLEKLKTKKQARLEHLASLRKDEHVAFEDLGVDALLIDESHRYKRGEFFTQLDNVKGLDKGSAMRSHRTLLKVRAVQERTGGKNIVFSTGTPISNTIAELWTLLRYVRPDLLEVHGMRQFDDFSSSFVVPSVEQEETPSGGFALVTRLNRYVNAHGLLTAWRRAADVVINEDVELPGVPKLKGGKIRDVTVPRPEIVGEFIAALQSVRSYWDSLPGAERAEATHVPLVINTRAKQAAVDMRLLDSSLPEPPNSKLRVVADEVLRIYKETDAKKGAQLVFSDMHSSRDGKFNVYEDIRQKLIAGGIPAAEIVIMESGLSDAKKSSLFDSINAGEVRVVLGDTQRLGTGVNVQQRLAAAHHVDAPPRPMDYEQRNGRIIRQGNTFPEVEVINYGVERTFDSLSYDRLRKKQRFINQIIRGDLADDSFDDPSSELQFSFQDMLAAFSGNPLQREQFAVEQEVRKLQAMQRGHADQQYQLERDIRRIESMELPAAQSRQKQLAAQVESAAKAFPDNKIVSAKIGNTSHDRKSLTDALVEADDARITDVEGRAEAAKKAKKDFGKDFTSSLKVRFGDWTADLTWSAKVLSVGSGVHVETGRVLRVLDANGELVVNREFHGGRGISTIIENQIKTLQDWKKSSAERITQLEKELRESKESLGAPFRYAADLEKAIARLDEIETELAATEAAQAVEDTGKIGEGLPQGLQDVLHRVLHPREDAPASQEAEETQAKWFRRNADEFEPVPKAKAVNIHRDLETFTYKLGNEWVVVEARSGLSIGKGRTQKAAIDAAKDAIDANGIEKVKQSVDAAVENTGLSPRYDADTFDRVAPPVAMNPLPAIPTAPGPRSKVVPLHEQVQNIVDAFGLTVRYGKIPSKVLGRYRGMPRVIRMRHPGDVGTLWHEIAHYLDRALKMPKKAELRSLAPEGTAERKQLAEGYAEFVRYYVTDPATAQAAVPTFYKEFTEQAKAIRIRPKGGEFTSLYDAILEARKAWEAYTEAPSLEKVASFVRYGRDERKHRWWSWGKLQTELWDELYPILELGREVERRTGKKLRASENPGTLAWGARGWVGRAQLMLDHAMFRITEKGYEETGEPLGEILADLDEIKVGPAPTAKQKLARAIFGRDAEGFTAQELLDVYLIAKRAANDPRVSEGFAGLLSPADFHQAIAELEPVFQPIADRLYEYSDGLMDYLVDAGRITQESADSIRERNLFYAPLYRVFEGDESFLSSLSKRKFGNVPSPIKRLKGSTRPVWSPVESLVYNTLAFVNAAERNRVGAAIIDIVESVEAMGDLVEPLPIPVKPIKISTREAFEQLHKDMREIAAANGSAAAESFAETLGAMLGHMDVIKTLEELSTDPAVGLEEWEAALEAAGLKPEDVFAIRNVLTSFRPSYATHQNEAIFHREGKPYKVELDKDLYEAVMAVGGNVVNGLARLISTPARIRRTGATVNLTFPLRNLSKDAVTAFLGSDYGVNSMGSVARDVEKIMAHALGIKSGKLDAWLKEHKVAEFFMDVIPAPFWDTLQGMYHRAGKTKTYRRFLAAGGAHASLVSMDRDYLGETVTAIKNRGKWKRVRRRIGKSPISWLQIMSEFFEEVNRIPGFKRAFEIQGGNLDALLTGGVEARDMTLDFSRTGRNELTKFWRQMTAFWGARMQGFDKSRRLLTRDKRTVARTMMRAFFAYTVPSLLIAFLFGDDEAYQDAPWWAKTYGWVIPIRDDKGELIVRLIIPKGFALGVLFGSLPEMIVSNLREHDPDAYRETRKSLLEEINPFQVPSGWELAWELPSNYSQFQQRSIVPPHLERVAEVEQYTFHTSETIKLLAKAMDKMGLGDYASPMKIEYAIGSLGGGLARETLKGLDTVLERTGVVDVPPKPEGSAADIPGLRGFVLRYPSHGRTMEAFYRTLNDLRTDAATAKKQQGEASPALGLARSFGMIKGRRTGDLAAMEKAASVISGVRAVMQYVRNQKGPKWEASEGRRKKRLLLDGLSLEATNVARIALGKEPVPVPEKYKSAMKESF